MDPVQELAALKLRFDSLAGEHATLKASLTAAEASAKAEKTRADKAEAERDTAKENLTQVRADASDEKIEERVNTRLALVESVRRLAPSFKLPLDAKGKPIVLSDRELRISAIKVKRPTFDATGKSDDYVADRFDSFVEDIGADSLGSARTDARDATGAGADDVGIVGKAQDKFRADSENAWKGQSK